MPFALLDDKFHSNAKILKVGDDGAGLYVRALSYCADHLTDGFVPMVWAKQTPKRRRDKLVEATLWLPVSKGETITMRQKRGEHQLLVPDDGYVIPDYLFLNPSRREIEEKRTRQREGGKAGAQSRWGDRSTHSSTNGSTHTPTHDDLHGPSTQYPVTERDLSEVVPTPRARATLLHELAEALHDHDDRTVWVLEREARHVNDRFLEQLATTCHLNRKGSGYAVNALRAERGRQLVANVDLRTVTQ